MSSPLAALTLSNGSTFDISGSCSIGRSSSNQVTLPNNGVSRRHALIHFQGSDGHWIVDLGSSNGTHLNGQAVVRPLKLSGGDIIKIGNDKLTFSATDSSSLVETLAGPTQVEVRISPQWVLVADIEEFTSLSQRLDSSELAHTVGSWIQETRTIVQAHNGVIHKYLGDGWLGGWPEDHPSRIASCLKQLRKLREQSDLSFRLAIHFGEVTSSGVGTAGEQEMLGPELNFLFRMEKIGANAGAACLLSKAAHEKIARYYRADSIGYFPLKGFESEFEFFA